MGVERIKKIDRDAACNPINQDEVDLRKIYVNVPSIPFENPLPRFFFFSYAIDQLRDKPRPSDLVAQQPLGEAAELGRGRIARTATPSIKSTNFKMVR
jgi:hypothetical protein